MRYLVILALILFISFQSSAQKKTLVYDGTSTYLDCTENAINFNGVTTFTQEAWVYVENVAKSYQLILGSEWEASSNFRPPSMYIRNTTGLHFGFGDGTDWYSINIFGDHLSVDAWNHYAVTFDGTLYRCYINGIEIAFDGSFASGKTPGNYPVRGIGAANANNYFNGKIDEVRMWNTVRSLEEIRETMNRTMISPYPAGLVSYYKFDEASGSTTTNEIAGIPDASILGTINRVDSDAFNTWLGASSDWSVATNWSQGTLPESDDNVGIYDNYTNAPQVTSLEVLVNSTIMGQTTTLTVDENSLYASTNFYSSTTNSITIDGELDVEGTLDLKGSIDGEGLVYAGEYILPSGVEVFGLTPANGSKAASGTWLGGGTTNEWNNSGNWNKDKLPKSSTSVLIDEDYNPSHWPTHNTSPPAVCKSIDLSGTGLIFEIGSSGELGIVGNGKTNGYLEISSGNVLINGGDLNVTNFVIVSDGILTIDNAAVVQIDGDVNVLSNGEIKLDNSATVNIGPK